MTRLAVIIPCYRDAATLARALDSVRAQTRLPDEIIVVNDCSPETELIEGVVSAYRDVRYVANPRNVGLAATRNAGVRASSADVVTFLDADDELHPQKLAFQLSIMAPNVALTCAVRRIGDEIGIASCKPFDGVPLPITRIYDAQDIIRRNRLTGAAMMISRSLFDAVGGYDESLRSCEDFNLWLRLLGRGTEVVRIDLPLYLYRVNSSGLSRNYRNISRWELEVVCRHFERMHAEGIHCRGEGITVASWLLRHMLRYELARDTELRATTLGNLNRLRRWPALRFALIALDRIRVLRWVAKVRQFYV